MTKLKLIELSIPPSESDFLAIEAKFGIVFPPTLKAHYLLENGGIPDCHKMYYVPVGSNPGEVDEVTFNGFYPIRYQSRPTESTLEENYIEFTERQKLFDPKKYIPFGYDVSGYPLLIDFENQGIHLLNRDMVDENDNELVEYIVNSLEVFLSGLMPADDYENSL